LTPEIFAQNCQNWIHLKGNQEKKLILKKFELDCEVRDFPASVYLKVIKSKQGKFEPLNLDGEDGELISTEDEEKSKNEHHNEFSEHYFLVFEQNE
jgi:hypothetical protein